ncbi:MAG TPA: HIT domain-containing protein [Bacteriovoracaceae bacterium]|nr:HIT domain-containing protein [Bacteriovoracaceae bacterium]
MAADCIFCNIVAGKIPSQKIFENDSVIGFKDLRPQASLHHLFIHKKHSKDVAELMKHDPSQVSDLFTAMTSYSENEGLNVKGYRIVTNLGSLAGQTVFHTHFHLLSGEPLSGFGA